ncbi:MAG: 3'-5' exonuclease, partial [Anaerolineales bacterium]|nr:3'-5' exonuclease [Anaerolineales bacterium]
MPTIVSIDIETTGLDFKKDVFIEIGAVRFNNRRVEDEWSTLINPGRPIPPFITQLTCITNQMVLQAPAIEDVLTELADFVGDAPILGHNVRFDLSFLKQQRIFEYNEAIDTYEVASVILPTSERYNLGALAQSLGVPFPATHRALDDAHATRGVYLRLLEEAMQLPLNVLAEIVRQGERMEWGAYWLFRRVLRARSKEIVSAQEVRHSYHGPLFEDTFNRPLVPLQPLESPDPLDLDEVTAILEPGGILAKRFP